MIRRTLIAIMLVGFVQASMYRAEAQSAADKESMLAQKLSIHGLVTNPLGGNYCLTGNTTEHHNLGVLPGLTNIRVVFQSNFDPVASLMCYRIGQDHVNTDPNRKSDAQFGDDDDGGGSLEPLINIQTPHECSVYIFVGQFNGSSHGTAAKCYDMEVTITPPPGTTTAR